MHAKSFLVLAFAAIALAQRIPTWPIFGGNRGAGLRNSLFGNEMGGGWGLWDAANRQVFGHNTWGYGLNDAEDRLILKELARLDAVNRQLVKKILELNVADRKIVGDVARGINEINNKKGALYPLTLWNRVLKIKHANAPFPTTNQAKAVNQEIDTEWINTDQEEKRLLKDLVRLCDVDPRIVQNLLWLDEVDRKALADLTIRINDATLRKGPAYPQTLWERVLRINADNELLLRQGDRLFFNQDLDRTDRGFDRRNADWRVGGWRIPDWRADSEVY